jgi:hypothetical protein
MASEEPTIPDEVARIQAEAAREQARIQAEAARKEAQLREEAARRAQKQAERAQKEAEATQRARHQAEVERARQQAETARQQAAAARQRALAAEEARKRAAQQAAVAARSRGSNVTLPIPPTAAEVRSSQPTVLGIPNAEAVWRAAAGGLGGALIGATLITIMPTGVVRWLGALAGLTTGTVLAATSPAGTLPQEMGVGLLSISGGWMVFDLAQGLTHTATAVAPAWLTQDAAPCG